MSLPEPLHDGSTIMYSTLLYLESVGSTVSISWLELSTQSTPAFNSPVFIVASRFGSRSKANIFLFKNNQDISEQESIPLGCVPLAFVVWGMGMVPGVRPGGMVMTTTPVKTLPNNFQYFLPLQMRSFCDFIPQNK